MKIDAQESNKKTAKPIKSKLTELVPENFKIQIKEEIKEKLEKLIDLRNDIVHVKAGEQESLSQHLVTTNSLAAITIVKDYLIQYKGNKLIDQEVEWNSWLNQFEQKINFINSPTISSLHQ